MLNGLGMKSFDWGTNVEWFEWNDYQQEWKGLIGNGWVKMGMNGLASISNSTFRILWMHFLHTATLR